MKKIFYPFLFLLFFAPVFANAAGQYCVNVHHADLLDETYTIECYQTQQLMEARITDRAKYDSAYYVEGVSIGGGAFVAVHNYIEGRDSVSHGTLKFDYTQDTLYCAQYTERVGTFTTSYVPVTRCFKSSQACNDAYKTSSSVDKVTPWQDCDGDGIKRNNGGKDIVDFDGKVIPQSKVCFTATDGKLVCEDNSTNCESSRRSYITNNDAQESDVGNCSTKTPEEIAQAQNPKPIGPDFCFKDNSGNSICKSGVDAKAECEAARQDLIDNDIPSDSLGACGPKGANPNTPPTDANNNANKPPTDTNNNSNKSPTDNNKNPDNTFKVKLSNPLGNNITNINQLITRFVQIALDIGLILASLSILWSGFLFVKAQGDSKKITDARNRLQWSVIGLAILLASNVIVTIVKSTVESLSVK